MYGKKGSELVKELASSEPGQLSAFNNDLFAQVINECTGHLHHLGSLIRKIEELKKIEEIKKLNNQELEESEKQFLKAHNSGALIHHLSLLRNKRCLMAYVYNRAETIRSLGWAVERVLPEEIEEKLSGSEKEYFKNHAASLQSYMSELDLDLAVDMVPPKDPYIKVRVLEDIGNVLLSDQSANLARHAILFLRRTDAEQYISQAIFTLMLWYSCIIICPRSQYNVSWFTGLNGRADWLNQVIMVLSGHKNGVQLMLYLFAQICFLGE